MPSKKDIARGRHLQCCRKERELSQENLAKTIGVTKQTIYNLESGKGWSQIDKIASLCEVLGLSIQCLFEIDNVLYPKFNTKDIQYTVLKDESRVERIRMLLGTNNCEISSTQSTQEKQ
jgi:DNA-binding XRE family transcriptional regulator